jgi:hypothetical protein
MCALGERDADAAGVLAGLRRTGLAPAPAVRARAHAITPVTARLSGLAGSTVRIEAHERRIGAWGLAAFEGTCVDAVRHGQTLAQRRPACHLRVSGTSEPSPM